MRKGEEDKAFAIEGIYRKNHLNVESISCRQAFHAIKGPHTNAEIAKPAKCDEHAPNHINVYSDGSFKNPRSRHWSLGGAGVWWPARDHGLSKSEFEMAFESKAADGVKLRTAIGGFGGSSTRCEIAACILALAAPGPVHIGTDSKATMDKARIL